MPPLGPAEFKRQCVLAAYWSRLDPLALHQDERRIISIADPAQLYNYLAIRNSILRLWLKNPAVFVSLDEAIECAKDKAFTGFAVIAYEWLSRRGYINFGCLTITTEPIQQPLHLTKQTTIVIVGAGVSGLACARHIDNFIRLFPDRWLKRRRELLPRILLLEGRKRIGGRVYSHPLRSQVPGSLPGGLANTAEMGAQIITGFERGNPLDALVRGQLALMYHSLKDDLVLYDHNGVMVDEARDRAMQALYIRILETASEYGWKPASKMDPSEEPKKMPDVPMKDAADVDFVNPAMLSNGSGNINVAQLDATRLNGAMTNGVSQNGTLLNGAPDHGVPLNGTFLNGSYQNTVPVNGTHLNGFVKETTKPSLPTLGTLMDSIVQKYQQEKGLSAQDMRLLNWHYANLEYGNAVNVNKISLGGWDQDGGNEFDGSHAHILGGYTQVPRALWRFPEPLDVRFQKIAARINYTGEDVAALPKGYYKPPAVISCSDGTLYEADHVVSTLSLGVMHNNPPDFSPPLPSWKTSVMGRMGFGVLNKVILVFDHVFWERDRDMFGLLNQTSPAPDSMNQPDYARMRGRSFLFWNCVKTCGRPLLVALMAGDAAEEAEHRSDEAMVGEVTLRLAQIFKLPQTPRPVEAIVTRWRKDPFARGSYSYLGPHAQPGDYDLMAQKVGNLHFAGEATCGTHPATVHGAYLSGLRAASEVIEAMIGPIGK
ncbi:hypothetical protein FH972_025925 [Carpinus fangiana]|uniref:SWIRM domain-containing protein n=1 Tax=Carpinus fangiana TaxID=176857 RepID=A0A5N6L2F1_9ROSI|nr:hypothetical protein FH972_025925 [Carpinus fangiana]